MCGIAGVVAKNAKDYYPELASMIKALDHRGPDSNGTKEYSNCLLGHTRLSIVDIKGGVQPMLDETSKIALSFNGEIYGYKKIKRDLLSEWVFKTDSDTEVVLALYMKYGVECVKYLKGMFAFIIFDENKNRVFCARDHFGQKPLYYARDKKENYFIASEIKALLATKRIERQIDDVSMKSYFKRLYVPPQRSIFKNIKILPAAHAMVIENGKTKVWRYWQQPQTNESLRGHDNREEFLFKLDTAIENHVIADVPVASFLSGGCDSSTIVALAQEKMGSLKTFSYGFTQFSELAYAKQIAQKNNTTHHEYRETNLDLIEVINTVSKVYDEPFADSSNIPTYLLCKEARKHGKVMLGGDGADELLGGYAEAYRSLMYMDKFSDCSKIELMLKRFQYKLKSKIFSGQHNANEMSTGCLYLLRGEKSLCHAHLNKYQYYSNSQLEKLGLGSVENLSNETSFSKENTVQDALKADIENYMPGDILTKVDRASMANGLEVRSPFLDIDLAEWLISLPLENKINTEKDKILLRESCQHLWTEDIRKRPKQGFGADVSDWLKQKEMVGFVSDQFSRCDLKIYNYFPKHEVKNIVNQKDYQSWSMLTLTLWMEQYLYD
jgi:asparagine synthase (glutamine-hydrolysing)